MTAEETVAMVMAKPPEQFPWTTLGTNTLEILVALVIVELETFVKTTSESMPMRVRLLQTRLMTEQ